MEQQRVALAGLWEAYRTSAQKVLSLCLLLRPPSTAFVSAGITKHSRAPPLLRRIASAVCLLINGLTTGATGASVPTC